MMDIYCPKCGEPWDLDSLHEEAGERAEFGVDGATFSAVRQDFAKQGCDALALAFGYSDCKSRERDTYRASASSALMDLFGDDVDGVAAMLEDFGI